MAVMELWNVPIGQLNRKSRIWVDLCSTCRARHCIELKQRTHEVQLGLLYLGAPLDGDDVVVERHSQPAEQEEPNVG